MGFRSSLFFLVVICVAGCLHSSMAQPLHPGVELTRPDRHTANALDAFRTPRAPKVGLYYPGSSGSGRSVEDSIRALSVQEWEYFLVGLQLPYTLLTDSTFGKSAIDPLKLLIVAEPDVLADSSLDLLEEYVEKGGGLIASGIHAGTRSGDCAASERFTDFIGASRLMAIDMSATRIAHKLVGDSELLKGHPLGFELDILPAPLCTAVAGDAVSIGYQSEGTSEEATLMMAQEIGEGRVVWTGFGPQDIPPAEAHQLHYQGLMVNAMTYATDVASARVRRWPRGYHSATVLMQLPSSGYQPFSYRTTSDMLLSALQKASTRATFFLVSRQAKDHPDLVNRMNQLGEIALVADTQKPLSGLRPELQLERLSAGKTSIESLSGSTLSGILPPGYFYDANTLHAVFDLEIGYMLSGTRSLIVPEFIPWEAELDYRDSLLTAQALPPAQGDSLRVSYAVRTGADSLPERLVRLYPTLYSYDLTSPVKGEPEYIRSNPLKDRWTYRLDHSFEEVHRSGGLFIFAFEPEPMGLTQDRASILEAFGNRLKQTSTWSATLLDVVRWWRAREQVAVRIESATDTRAVLIVSNDNEAPIRDLALTAYLPALDLDRATLKAGDLDVEWEAAGDRFTIQIKELPTGDYTLEWVLEASDVE